MTTKTTRKLFVNLPVRDLKKTMEFYSKLGFEFNRQFTDDKAACMIISEEAFVMLLTEPFFKTFTTREIVDPSTHVQALFSLSCESRAEVDDIVKRAVDAGGKAGTDHKDHGFMYEWSFYDVDGHGWGVMWMDPGAAQQQN